MLQAVLRWSILLIGLFLIGPMTGALTAALRMSDGSLDASILVTASPVQGILAALGAFGLAGAVGVVSAKLFGARPGFFVTGLALAWAAWGTGRVDELLRSTGTASTMYTLAAEGALVGAIALAVGMLIVRFARTEAPVHEQPAPSAVPVLAGAGNFHPPHSHWHTEPRKLWDATAPAALAAVLVVGGIVAWLVARDSLKGQTFAAAAFAGFFGATAGRLASQKVSPVIFLGAIVALAVLAPIVATFMYSGIGLLRASQAGTLFPLARVLPLDWCAGGICGNPARALVGELADRATSSR